MSRVADIRRLCSLGGTLLSAVTAEDPEELATAFAAYDQQFQTVQNAIEASPPTAEEQAALADVAEVHSRVEEAVARRHAATGELIARLAASSKLSAYAPVQRAARAPRYLDAAA